MADNILVVDDEAGVREAFRMMLSDEYNVFTSTSGIECLDFLQKGEKISLVMLDLMMPGISGMDILKKIRQLQPSLPVVIITAVGTHDAVMEALKFGANDFIAKPVDVYRAKEIVKKVLTQSRGKDRNFLNKRNISAEELLKESFSETIEVLNEIIELKSPSLAKHSKWTAKYAVTIAERLGFSREQVEVIRQTSLLHDIGKIGISDAILNKKEDEWTLEEKEQLKKHPEIGGRILSHFKLMHIEQTMIRYHHENYDGSGYPDGLKGDEIPIYARIMAMANAFEKMVSSAEDNEDKKFSHQQAVEELHKASGTKFDPQIVDTFKEIVQA